MSIPDPQQYVCLGGSLLCPAAYCRAFFSNNPFTFSFAKVFSFTSLTFLISFFHLKFSEMPISENI